MAQQFHSYTVGAFKLFRRLEFWHDLPYRQTGVEGTESEPAVQTGTAHQKFTYRKNHALSNIVLHIEPSLLYIIGDPMDPKDVLDQLRENVGKQIEVNTLTL